MTGEAEPGEPGRVSAGSFWFGRTPTPDERRERPSGWGTEGLWRPTRSEAGAPRPRCASASKAPRSVFSSPSLRLVRPLLLRALNAQRAGDLLAVADDDIRIGPGHAVPAERREPASLHGGRSRR